MDAIKRKIFISYSWSTPTHEAWVINLAQRLVADGVDVTIDKWDLKEGHDKFIFMESMVKSTEINKVLIVLDKKYAEKADQRSGGVGTETQIISPEVYTNVSQEKFIPIVAERREDGEAYVPTFLKGRIYIDMSSDDQFETNYEALLRNIYDRPLHSKPKLGQAPSYLFEDSPISFRTSSILRSFDSALSKNPERIDYITRDFLEEFYNNLKGFKISFERGGSNDIGKQIVDNLVQYKPLRDDFILFYEKVTKNGGSVDSEIIIKFLERLYKLTDIEEGHSGSWHDYDFDNFKIIVHELFLYIVLISLKNERFALLEDLFYSSYFIKTRYQAKLEPSRFDIFHFWVEGIDAYYKQTFAQNLLSPVADFWIKRIPDAYTKSMFVEADLICHYVAVLNGLRWFPITYIYNPNPTLELIARMVSQRHFDKVKGLFNVKDVGDLRDKLVSFQLSSDGRRSVGYQNSFESVRPLHKVINIENVGISR